MTAIMTGFTQLPAHETDSQTAPLLISVPDAERLALQWGFVRSRLEAEILSEIEGRIRSATLLDPAAVPRDLVTMNTQVRLRDMATSRVEIVTLVFPSSAKKRGARVSVVTPLGALLLGAREGQTITCPLSGEMATMVVDAILHQPEALGDYYG